MDRSERDAFLAHIRQQVADHGVAVVAVGGDASNPGFAYTVGLTALGKPELTITGPLDPRIMQTLLNDAAPRSLAAGDVLDDILSGGLTMRVVTADPFEAEAFVVTDMYGPEAVTVLQLLWPDPQGNFPGDEAYDSRACPQPLRRRRRAPRPPV